MPPSSNAHSAPLVRTGPQRRKPHLRAKRAFGVLGTARRELTRLCSPRDASIRECPVGGSARGDRPPARALTWTLSFTSAEKRRHGARSPEKRFGNVGFGAGQSMRTCASRPPLERPRPLWRDDGTHGSACTNRHLRARRAGERSAPYKRPRRRAHAREKNGHGLVPCDFGL
jgi:hypothetical protein